VDGRTDLSFLFMDNTVIVNIRRLICLCLQFTQMTGSCEDHPPASELKILVPQEGDLFDTTRSCQHPHHSSCEDADDQCNNSSGSSAGVTTALTRTTDALVNQSADSTDLLSAGSVTETQEDARETAEVDNVELDKCLAAFTHDSDGLDVVECDTASANKLDTVQSVELAETLDTNDDISDVIESDEVSTKVSGGAATVESPECYDVLSAADRLSTDHHIACVEECRPDSSEPHIIADTVESTGDGGDAGRPAAAVSSVISSSDEHINMLHSLISQLKSAVSSAHAGNKLLSLLLVGKCLHFSTLTLNTQNFCYYCTTVYSIFLTASFHFSRITNCIFLITVILS